MSISSRSLAAAIATVSLVAAGSVPAAEGAFRLAGARPSDDLESLYAPFGQGGYRARANVRTSADWYSGYFTVWTDDLGLRRGRQPGTATKPGDEVDFLFLGSSQGFGQGVSYEETIVGQFRSAAIAHGHPAVKVANASVGGHYLENQLEIAHWLVNEQGVSCRTLVVLIDAYVLESIGAYNRVTVSEDGKLWGSDPSWLSRVVFWAKTHTAIYGVFRNAYWNVVGMDDDLGPVAFYRTGDAYEDRMSAALRKEMNPLLDLAHDSNADLYLAYVPSTVEFDFSNVSATAAQRGLAVDAEAPFRRLERVAGQSGVPLIDLRPPLAARAKAGQPLSLKGDPHYNADTSRAVGAYLWTQIPWPDAADNQGGLNGQG